MAPTTTNTAHPSDPNIPSPIHFVARLQHPLSLTPASRTTQQLTLFRNPFHTSALQSSFPNIFNPNDVHRMIHTAVSDRLYTILVNTFARAIEEDFDFEFRSEWGGRERRHVEVSGTMDGRGAVMVEYFQWERKRVYMENGMFLGLYET